MKNPKIVAHRGRSNAYPENSLVAFAQAAKLGVDGVECDVHFTAEGEAVILHDATIDRTTTGTGTVRQMTLDQVQKFHLVCRNGPEEERQWPDQKIPTFDEFLNTVGPTGLELRVEIKDPGFERQIVAKIKDRGLEPRTTIISFLPPVICEIKDIDRAIRTSLLTARFAQIPYDHIRDCIDGVDFQFGPDLDRSLYEQIRRDGLIVDFWTIDDLDEFHRALAWEPDYITTNYPDLLMKELRRPATHQKNDR